MRGSSSIYHKKNNMDIEEYGELMFPLVSDQGSFHMNLVHMALGISGECGEITDIIKKHWILGKDLDVAHLKEEIGDVLFYMNGMATSLGAPSSEWWGSPQFGGDQETYANTEKNLRLLPLRVGHVSGLIAHAVYQEAYWGLPIGYSGPLDNLGNLGMLLSRIAEIAGFTLEDALDANVAKLSVRYPGLKFDADKGLNRDVAAEAEAMRR